MSNSAMKSQLYGFGMLTIAVIFAIDHLNSQTFAAQLISGAMVISLLVVYASTAPRSKGLKQKSHQNIL